MSNKMLFAKISERMPYFIYFIFVCLHCIFILFCIFFIASREIEKKINIDNRESAKESTKYEGKGISIHISKLFLKSTFHS